MNISPDLAEAFQAQFNAELANHAAYRQMAINLQFAMWDGTSKWFETQACEEMKHAGKITKFLLERMVSPRMRAMDAPSVPLGMPLVCFSAALGLEQANTTRLNTLYNLCAQGADNEAQVFLQLFLTEQRESEASIEAWITKWTRAQNSYAAQLELDEKLGET